MRFFNSTSDLGLGFKHFKGEKRIINKDGSFNVLREGLSEGSLNLYQDLIKMPWSSFLSLIFITLLGFNFLFAIIYFLCGVENFNGITERHWFFQFLQLSSFSFQTFTTVGYGHINPASQIVSFISSIESVIGLSSFAIVTGLLYGRFSKPVASLIYSEKSLIAPYGEGKSWQFRIANRRNSVIMELSATVLLMYLEKGGDKIKRKFELLNLERDQIVFFPLNWTIVHPIDESSPLNGWGEKELKESEAEFIIMLKGYDDTFGDYVFSRYSYRYDEIEWNASFKPVFNSNEDGDVVLHLDQISSFERLEKSPVEK